MLLEQADFRAIQMKRDGTAFLSKTGIWSVIDQSGLDTGRIAVVDFKPNGQVANLIRLRPWHLSELLLLLIGLDMPLLDILEETRQRREFGWAEWGSQEIWTREIDRNAPEYLVLEAQGRESEFNLESIRSVCDDQLGWLPIPGKIQKQH
ncbi:hypothetical protein Asppvi_002562 [Aspergillus pseudoviridinutans]|uniref:Uncharacterized protein n=1 Tax=Aspergillus pseudoviridinutans TaxID=1517512 RepID=A0A9P3B3M9_9EURO|nr:uncharacterized protein Asppvi_002562 [Aspergillus pseudoviridinutans]GIJ83732.1 hypothetical protein Asppvi_002562 [Aspergillus pseudoviridinutans]